MTEYAYCSTSPNTVYSVSIQLFAGFQFSKEQIIALFWELIEKTPAWCLRVLIFPICATVDGESKCLCEFQINFPVKAPFLSVKTGKCIYWWKLLKFHREGWASKEILFIWSSRLSMISQTDKHNRQKNSKNNLKKRNYEANSSRK